jgi:hypothetical protein
MAGATNQGFATVFMMILAACLSLGLPAEDVLDAVYDEVEAVPCEVAPLSGVAARPMVAGTTQSPRSSLQLKLGALSRSAPARVRDTDGLRSADPRALYSLLCILLC